MCSPRLPVGRVLAAPPAVLLQLQAVRVVLLVLDRRVVAPFAVAALKGDDRFHRSLCRWGSGCWIVEVEKRSPGSPRRRQWYHLFGCGHAAGPTLPSPTRGEREGKKREMLYVGTSGWQYRDWRGALYPPKPAPARPLRPHAARV